MQSNEFQEKRRENQITSENSNQPAEQTETTVELLKESLPSQFRNIDNKQSLENETEESIKNKISFLEIFSKNKLASSFLFKPRNFECKDNGRIYRLMGTHLFLKYIAPNHNKKNNSQKNVFSSLLNFGLFNETFSLCVSVYSESISAIEFSSGNHVAGVCFFALTTATGIYPFMGARYQRVRLFNFANRSVIKDKRQSS